MKIRVQSYLLSQLLPDSSLSTRIEPYLTRFGTNSRALGIIGAIALIASAIILVSQVEQHLNSIWGAGKRRSIPKRVLTYYPTIILFPFLIAGSLFLTTKLQILIAKTSDVIPHISLLFGYITPYIMTFIALTLIFKYLPHTQIEWKSAILSGIIASVTWENSKIVFTLYVSKIVNYSKIYGTISILPIFLLYLFFSWLIIYLAAEIGSVFQNFKGQRGNDNFRVISFTDYLTVLHLICKNFYDNGLETRLSIISKKLYIPNEMVNKITEHLVYLGIIKKNKRHKFIPAIPLSEIDLTAIWNHFIKNEPYNKYLKQNEKLYKYLLNINKNSSNIFKNDKFGDLLSLM